MTITSMQEPFFFTLVLGRQYVARNGCITSPLVKTPPDKGGWFKAQPFAGCFAETGDKLWTWRPDGRTWSGLEWELVREAEAA
jgi:hypothetical protein